MVGKGSSAKKMRDVKQKARKAVQKAAPNPFEIRKTKEKNQVLGKVQPQSHRAVGHARAHAFEMRKNTLLKELEMQEKHNVFVDKRETQKLETKGMSDHDLIKMKFDKLLGKAPKERGAPKKKNIFNLTDKEVTLTGSALGIQTTPRDEDEIADNPTETGEGEEGKKKSKREMYAEIIAKSKYYKYLRQKEREERQNITDELDEQFKDLQEEFFATKRTSDDKYEDEKNKDPNDDYMKLFRTFEMEGRAPASDRSKTTEELVKEENEKLLKLEEERLKRMLGELQGEPDAKRQRTERSGDDLTDDYGTFNEGDEEVDLDDEEQEAIGNDDFDGGEFGGEIDESLLEDGEEEEEGEGEEEEDESSSSEDESEEEEEEAKAVEEETAETSVPQTPSADLAYKIDVPADYKTFTALLEGRSLIDRTTIVDRIMVTNHYSLNRALNVPKMKRFLRLLWQRFVAVAKFKHAPKKEVFAELNHLAKHLWQLSQQFSEIIYEVTKTTLGKLYSKFMSKLESGDSGALSMQIVVVLQIIGNIFPTTDFRNPVVTPSFLFLGHSISLVPILKVSHLFRALFLANIAFNWVSESRRYISEPLTLLGSILEQFANTDPKTKLYYTCPSLTTFDTKNFRFQTSPTKLKPHPLDLTSLTFSDETELSDQTRLDLLHFAIQLTSKYFGLYSDSKSAFLDSLPQIFTPIKYSLEKIEAKDLCKTIKENLQPLLSTMAKTFKEIESKRTPLKLQETGPVVMDSLVPNYNSNYSGKKMRISDMSDREQNKMRKKRIHKEQKAAARELRNDTIFVQGERLKRAREEDARAQEHTNKIMALLQKEAHEKKLDTIRKNPLKFTNRA